MQFVRKDRFVLAALLAFGAFAPLPGHAQETSSAIRGRVLGADGAPVAGANVVIIDTRTGSTRTLTTSESGNYNSSGLRVGGPYKVTVSSTEGSTEQPEIYLNLGDTYALDLQVGDVAELETVTVTGARVSLPQTAIGPSSAFSAEDLASAPAVNRDIKDLLRIDPRIYIDDSFGDGVQCGGANPRFNSLTVDGVKFNDNFGLNASGYPTERMPFSYDVVDQVAVELAPFDVQYGGFSACNINAVTKSGTNEFHGSLFYDYTDDSLSGDELDGSPVNLGTFDEQRYGATLGGPIVRDKLFFLLSYEKLEGVNVFSRTPADVPGSNQVAGVTQADFERIVSIAQELYGYAPGGLPGTLPNEDEKILVKLDWNISDQHRAAFTYNYNDGFNIAQSDSSNFFLEADSHYYERGAELNSYVGQLFSDWTDAFSTELKVGYSELDNRQLSQGGTDFGEFRISTLNGSSAGIVLFGSDDSRHANKLTYDTFNLKAVGEYLLGNHVISGGYELESLDVFNLFIQNAEGTFTFADIDSFEAGLPSNIRYANAAGTNDKNDGAAAFAYDTNTVYLQDEYRFSSIPLRITAGLRYDWYESDDLPTENPNFISAYGFSNAQNVDGMDLLQPRLGFNWNPNELLEVHGGIGLFSGGNPNVWISNSYSNDGVTVVTTNGAPDPLLGESLFDPVYMGGGLAGYDIPPELFDAVATGSTNSSVNATDPDFEVPYDIKFALGTILYLPQDYRVMLDYLYSEKKDAAIVQDLSRVKVGEMADGRPIYSGVIDAGSGRARSSDFMLTNVDGDSGESTVVSVSLDKSYAFGLSWALGYAATSATEVNPMGSSVAFSNYGNVAVDDPENPGVATSNYEIPDRFTLKLDYKHAFFGDNDTKLAIFSSYNEGRPFSYTFTSAFNGTVGDSNTSTQRQLLYMPTGIDDPNVLFADPSAWASFFEFAESQGLDEYAGGTVPRNAFNSDWWLKVDLKLEQEVPGFFSGDKASLFVVIENFSNLLNDEWGVQKQAAFPQTYAVVDAVALPDGRYQFNRFITPASLTTETDASLYEIRVGFRYTF